MIRRIAWWLACWLALRAKGLDLERAIYPLPSAVTFVWLCEKPEGTVQGAHRALKYRVDGSVQTVFAAKD